MWHVLQPEGWAPPKGYANGIEARGRLIFVAGMIGWNGQAQFETDDFVGQCKQALQNIVDTLACANAGPQHIVRAYVVLKPGHTGDAAMEKALQEHVKQTIAPFKYPRKVVFMDVLPRTETGKLQRFRLRQMAMGQ